MEATLRRRRRRRHRRLSPAALPGPRRLRHPLGRRGLGPGLHADRGGPGPAQRPGRARPRPGASHHHRRLVEGRADRAHRKDPPWTTHLLAPSARRRRRRSSSPAASAWARPRWSARCRRSCRCGPRPWSPTSPRASTTSTAVPAKSTTTVAMDFGRLTLAEDLVLYLFGTPGPAPLLVHVGRPVPGRHRRDRAGRHRPARRVVLAAGLLRVQGPAVHRGGQPVRRRPSATPSTRSPTPWRCPPEVPIISVDARDRESAKQRAAVRVTEYALQRLTQSLSCEGELTCRPRLAPAVRPPGHRRSLALVLAAAGVRRAPSTASQHRPGPAGHQDGLPDGVHATALRAVRVRAGRQARRLRHRPGQRGGRGARPQGRHRQRRTSTPSSPGEPLNADACDVAIAGDDDHRRPGPRRSTSPARTSTPRRRWSCTGGQRHRRRSTTSAAGRSPSRPAPPASSTSPTTRRDDPRSSPSTTSATM